jgi:hypothetical protein
VEGLAEDDGTYTLTLERSANGTEAAAHAEGAAVFYYVPEATIQRATSRTAVWMYRQRDAPFEKVVTPAGDVIVPAGLPTDVADMLLRGAFVNKAAATMYAV